MTQETTGEASVAGVEKHTLESADSSPEERETAKRELLAQIKKDKMAPLYRKAVEAFGWPAEEAMLKEMEAAHKAELEALEEKLADARENYGDVEERDCLLEKAHFFCRIGNAPAAVEAYEVAKAKTVGGGVRLDISLTLVRIGFVFNDRALLKKALATAKEETEKGGDWERRNKLRIYQALDLIRCRNFKEACDLLLAGLSTFPSCAMLSFKKFIFYAVILALLCCDRPTLREKVLMAPPVLEGCEGELKELLRAFYGADYQAFMENLIPVASQVKRDLFLGRHFLFFIRSMRLRAYRQFLDPYKSVTLKNMALAFGVSPEFIEEEVAGFVASGKLDCTIDKVKGILEANRAEERTRLYLQTITQGDVLLNRVQKLARVLAM